MHHILSTKGEMKIGVGVKKRENDWKKTQN